MSRLYFASPSGAEAELAGPERAYLRHIAQGPAAHAFDLTGSASAAWERCQEIVALLPKRCYIHEGVEQAVNAGAAPNRFQLQDQAVDSLRIYLFGWSDGANFLVAGHDIAVGDTIVNTALAAGSAPVQLATKLSGWPWCLIEGKDRRWVADIIDAGLDRGIFRHALRYRDGESRDMGWHQVAAFLRSRDDEPVVTSHSTGDDFPYDASPEHDWQSGLNRLRLEDSFSTLSPETLGSRYFGFGATVYDIMSPDREARIKGLALLDGSW